MKTIESYLPSRKTERCLQKLFEAISERATQDIFSDCSVGLADLRYAYLWIEEDFAKVNKLDVLQKTYMEKISRYVHRNHSIEDELKILADLRYSRSKKIQNVASSVA